MGKSREVKMSYKLGNWNPHRMKVAQGGIGVTVTISGYDAQRFADELNGYFADHLKEKNIPSAA